MLIYIKTSHNTDVLIQLQFSGVSISLQLSQTESNWSIYKGLSDIYTSCATLYFDTS